MQDEINAFKHDARQELYELRKDVAQGMETGNMPQELNIKEQVQHSQSQQQGMSL
ncbi:MAG: hypothetical protein F6K62_10890 [Sphaerospermopsis sp. SIO1G2]|nr:hypothetical protein [Sphaerospermopsis sp. SIO1G2]